MTWPFKPAITYIALLSGTVYRSTNRKRDPLPAQESKISAYGNQFHELWLYECFPARASLGYFYLSLDGGNPVGKFLVEQSAAARGEEPEIAPTKRGVCGPQALFSHPCVAIKPEQRQAGS